ncbi:hypothetical protein B0H10DRAFT_2232917 [Mycena sp. CBHHK59/15]|nr:hypothetical protein B0H10DRAFT_2232917 [Mycena sp. CBHHK59/15]
MDSDAEEEEEEEEEDNEDEETVTVGKKRKRGPGRKQANDSLVTFKLVANPDGLNAPWCLMCKNDDHLHFGCWGSVSDALSVVARGSSNVAVTNRSDSP